MRSFRVVIPPRGQKGCFLFLALLVTLFGACSTSTKEPVPPPTQTTSKTETEPEKVKVVVVEKRVVVKEEKKGSPLWIPVKIVTTAVSVTVKLVLLALSVVL